MSRQKNISQADSDLFRQSIGDVKRISFDGVAVPGRKSRRSRYTAEDSPVLRDHVPSHPPPAPVGMGDVLSYRQPGVQQRLINRLRKGQIAIEGELDLHGLTSNPARRKLLSCLADCRARGIRCIRIIHGKGHGSSDNIPVIKNLLNRVLREQEIVLAFTSAPAGDGGTGVAYVLLRSME